MRILRIFCADSTASERPPSQWRRYCAPRDKSYKILYSVTMKERYTIITFESTTQAMEAEFLLKKNDQDGRIIPVPSSVKAGCGLAWGSTLQTVEYFTDYMHEHNIPYEQIQEVIF